MVGKYKISKLEEFDAAEYLTDREQVVAYFEAMLGDDDRNAELLESAIRDVVRAMSKPGWPSDRSSDERQDR